MMNPQAMTDQEKKYLDIKKLSGEVQIKGRTARLAQQNSFRIVFLDESLEYQDINGNKEINHLQQEHTDLMTTKQANCQDLSHVQIINIPQKQLNSPNFVISQIQNIMKSIETNQSGSIKITLLDNYMQVNLTYEPKMEDFNYNIFNLQKGQCFNLHISAACVPKYTQLDSYDEYQLQKQIKQKQKLLQKISLIRTQDLISVLQHQIIDQIKLKDYLFRHIQNEIEIYQFNNYQNLNTETQDSLSKIILALNTISLEANFIGQTKEILNLIGNEIVSKIQKMAYYKQKLEQILQNYQILQQNYSEFLIYNKSNQSHQISENEKIQFAAHSNCQSFLLLDNYYAHFNNYNGLLLQYTLNQKSSLQIFDLTLINKMKNIIQTYVLFVLQQIYQILYQLYLLQIIPVKLSIHNFYWVKSERDSTFQVKFDFKGIDYNIESYNSDAYFITQSRKLLQEIIINDKICQHAEMSKVIQEIQPIATNFNKQQFRELFEESVYHLNLYYAQTYQMQSISDTKTNSQSLNEQIQSILHTFLNNKDEYLHFLEEKKINYSQLQSIEIYNLLRYSNVFYKPIVDKIKQILNEYKDQNFAEQIKLQILDKASQCFTAQYFSIIQKQIYTDKDHRQLYVNPIIFFINMEDDDRLNLSVQDQYQNELQILPLKRKQKQNTKLQFPQQINQEIFEYKVDDQTFEININALFLLRQHFKKYNYNRILFNQQLKCLLPLRENGLTIWTSLQDFYLYAKVYSNNYIENQVDNSKKLQSYKKLGTILYLPCVRQLLNEFQQREKMFQPFRGIYCDHLECFDIKDAYQQICKGDMRCPIVGCQREIFDAYGTPCIVLDIEYKQILDEINNRYIDEKWEGCLYDLNEFIIEIGEDKFLNKKMYLEYFRENDFQNQEEQTSEQDYEAMEQQALIDDQVLEEEDQEDEEDD